MINEKNEHSWCVNAFHGMSANNEGSTKMCCMISDAYNHMDEDVEPIYIIGESKIEKNFNNPIARRIRSNLENGVRDSACTLCWQEEDGGRKSKRQRDNERYLHEIKWGQREEYEGLAKFELNLGNTCNISCRTCAASISSGWMREDYDLNFSKYLSYKEYANNMKKYHKNYDEDSAFWPDLIDNLETIKQFDFYGGEPFLSKKMWEVLQICIDRGYSKDIELHYNTNGTTWPSEIEMWKHFKQINLSFSIDGIGDSFEYMRHPAKWKVVQENMQKARQLRLDNNNMSISWCVTLSAINIFNLPEIVEEYDNNYQDFGIYLNLVHGPTHFNIGILPDEIKKAITNRLEHRLSARESVKYQLPGILGFMNNGSYDEKQFQRFIEYIDKHDEYRSEDFDKTFREYSGLVRQFLEH